MIWRAFGWLLGVLRVGSTTLILAALAFISVLTGPAPGYRAAHITDHMQLLIERENRAECSAFYASSFEDEKCKPRIVTSRLGVTGWLYGVMS